MLKLGLVAASAWVLAFGAQAAAQTTPHPAVGLAAPAADHHLHLVSPATAEVLTPTPKPPLTEVPDELSRLLRARELSTGPTPQLVAELYTADAVIRARNGGGWVSGANRIGLVLLDYVPGYRLVPVSYDLGADAGYVAGYFERGGRNGATFQFSLKRDGGRWRIAVDNITPTAVSSPQAVTADALIAELDAANIRRGVILGLGYFFGTPGYTSDRPEEDAVRSENDWTMDQAAKHPQRLVAFCGVNPLRDYAIREMERCARGSRAKGMKLHFAASRVSVDNPEHLETLRRFFSAANRLKMPVVVHMQELGGYGERQARIMLDQLLPLAPDIPVQIAHMAGSGPKYDQDAAFEVFASARKRGDPRVRNLYVDVASMAVADSSSANLQLMATRLREFGLGHVLFGSDRVPTRLNEDPKTAWASFRRLPFSEAEFRTVAENLAPYLR